MAVHQEGNLQFGAHPVRRRDENRFLVTLQVKGETSGKTTNLRQHLRAKGRFDHGFDRLDKGIALFDVNSRILIQCLFHSLPLDRLEVNSKLIEPS